MAAVTQVIPNFLGGVSKQTDQKKLPGQVRDCLNAYPDPTFGLMKRPGFKFIKTIYTSASETDQELKDAKWFFIKRDDNEIYIGCILNTTAPHADEPIRIWNKLGEVCTITYPDGKAYLDTTHDNYDVLTVQDTSIITNKTKVCRPLDPPDDHVPGSHGTIRLMNIAYSNRYMVKVKLGGAFHGDDYSTSIRYIGETTNLVDANRTEGNYLGITASSATYVNDENGNARTSVDEAATFNVTVNSSGGTIISLVNRGKGYLPGDTFTFEDSLFSPGGDEAGAAMVTKVLEVNDDEKEKIAAQYWTINAEDNTPANQVSTPSDEKYLTANRILTQLEAGLKATTILNHTWDIKKLDSTLEVKIKSTIYPYPYVAFELVTSDNQGNFSIESFNEDVNSVADLPAQALHNRIVRVVNSGPADTTYWSKFVAEDEVSGKGYWEESIDPTASKGLDKTTMPHELFNDDTDSFIFRQADWADRTVGDDTTNTHPGFILKDADGEYARTIQQCFYHNNRLGILTDDNVVMSKSSDFFNFYYTSALTIIDSDPIDINCSSLRPAVLHGVIPTAQGLILFSRNQQFIMFSDAEMLTPSSAIIRGISNYEMDPKIDPVESGTLINFVSKTPSTTRVFSVQTRGAEESPDVLDIGKIVSGWIPQTPKNLISSPVNSLVALYGDNSTTGTIGSPTIYIYKTYIVGERIVMQAWVKWDLPGNVQHVSIDADVMYAVVENSGKYMLCNTNLTEAPEETIITTKKGQSINPYMDMYATASSVTYDSSTPGQEFSKCYLPYADIADATPVILLKGDASAGEIAGFTLSPERGSDGTGPYFKVPKKNWSSTGEDIADDVIVGYKYNYDVELPKTYFKLNPEGTQYDYTASLTVARMKFAVGLSSVCGFKVQSKGYRGEIWEGTVADAKPDTGGKAYEVPFLLKEENGIKVTLDGARQNPGVSPFFVYTVTSNDTQSTVTFTTAPEGHTYKQLYGGGGYTADDGTASGWKRNLATTSSGNGTGLILDAVISSNVVSTFAITNQGTGYRPNEVITISGGTTSATFLIKDLPQKIAITTDTWYDVQASSEAGQYLADDVPLVEENIFTIPLHQRSENFNLRVFSNSPFPVSLASMMWEGQYSPRFYRLT